MSSQGTSRRGQRTQQPHLHVDTQHRDQLSSHPDPAAQFDYDFGPSNTQTRPGGGDAKSPDGSVEPGDDQDPDQLDHGKEDTIYYKAVTGTRARFPPEVKQGNGATVAPQSSTTSQSDSSTANGKKHKNSQSGVQYGCKTTLRQIMLDWGKGKKEGDDAQQNVLNATVQTGAGKVESQNSVVWQHSEVEDIELDELNNLSARLKATGLEESMIGLSKRLLKRVRLVTERDFVNGRFLTPTVMRYDMHDASRYGHGRSCMFVSFPYFDVSETRERGKFRKGDASHPIRTLLQSHYRLNETVDRDESQCIRTIGAPALKSCIQGGDTKRLCHKAHAELIYVPQMWALVIGLGHMLTAGPISDGALQTSELVINDRPRSDIHRCDFVRISFMNENMLEEVTYPREQCASWFALLNKHHEILHALPQKKKGANPKRFPLRIKEQMLSDDIWASVQRQSNEPVLELLMDTPKPPKMTITTFDSATSPKERQIGESEEFPKAQAMLMPSRAGADIERLGSVPVVRAFLAWRVMDEYGEINDCSVDVKTGRFLSTIYELLPARCVDGILDSGGRTTQYRPIPGFKGSPRPLLDIVGRTVDDVRAMGSIASSRETDITIQKKLFTEYEGLFGFFVPKEHDRGSAPVRLFWGSLYALLEHDRPFLSKLLEKIQDIKIWASRLHLGVHFERYKNTPDSRPTEYEDDISNSAILEESMVGALRAVFEMLIEAVREAKSAKGGGQDEKLPDTVAYYGNEACRLLKESRDQLIAEATGTTPERMVGPVVTPEAILLKTIRRLTRGVFGSGTVDVINIFEECLEQLALRVEKHSSRRLLQKLNAFEEEVGIISDVLQQQIKVLQRLRRCLDPDEFERPTIARKMRFEIEKQEIEMISTHIREQLRHCKELRERAKVLAVQNVQLVETLADDNGRAIFVFTFITVLFLPLSFVAGFFGMNLAGIAGTTRGVSHFWYIGVPLTVGILVLCAIFVAWGEPLWFIAADLAGECKKMLLWRRKRRKT